MKSKVAKVLHPVAGKPMIEYAVETAKLQASKKRLWLSDTRATRCARYWATAYNLPNSPASAGRATR